MPNDMDVDSPGTEEPIALTERDIAQLQGQELGGDASGDADRAERVTEDAAADAAGTDAPPPETDAEAGPKTKSWVDDEARELAASYGVSAEELEKFAGPDEFRRAAILAERALRRKEPAKTEEPPKRPGKDKEPAKGSEKAVEELEWSDPAELEQENWDPKSVAWYKATLAEREHRKALQVELASIKEGLEAMHRLRAEEDLQRTANAFHEAVDAHMDAERYGQSADERGRGVALSKEAMGRRSAIWEEVKEIARRETARAQAVGETPNLSMKAMLRRADFALYGDELLAAAEKKALAKVAEQAKRVRPVPGRPPARKTPSVEPAPDTEAARIAAEPEIVKKWNELHEESGMAG